MSTRSKTMILALVFGGIVAVGLWWFVSRPSPVRDADPAAPESRRAERAQEDTPAPRVDERPVRGLKLPGPLLIPLERPMTSRFRVKGTRTLVVVPPGQGELALRKTPAAISAANALADRFPEVRFSYYAITEWAMTEPAVRAGYEDPTRAAWDEFTAGVRPRAATGRLRVDDWEETFFTTDHHWKPRGAYRGYLDVMRLLSRDNPNVTAGRVRFSQMTVRGATFRGGIANVAGRTEFTEPFIALTSRVPGLRAYLKGERDDRLIYDRTVLTDPPAGPSGALYKAYNGADHALVSYRKDAPGAGNLLILGDSFSNAMEHLVAAHFRSTYSIDLRHYAAEYGEPFDMERFVARNRITDVLVMGRAARVISIPLAVRERTPVK